MPDWIYAPDDPLWQTLAGCLLMFVAIIFVTRLVGLRSFAKFTTFDFAFTVAIGSIISSTLTSSTSIAQGSIAIFGLLALTALFAFLQRKSNAVDKVINNQPLLLMDGPKVLEENMASGQISYEQLIAKLREANVIRMEQVRAVVLEATGDISVLHVGENSELELENELLTGVRKKP